MSRGSLLYSFYSKTPILSRKNHLTWWKVCLATKPSFEQYHQKKTSCKCIITSLRKKIKNLSVIFSPSQQQSRKVKGGGEEQSASARTRHKQYFRLTSPPLCVFASSPLAWGFRSSLTELPAPIIIAQLSRQKAMFFTLDWAQARQQPAACLPLRCLLPITLIRSRRAAFLTEAILSLCLSFVTFWLQLAPEPSSRDEEERGRESKELSDPKESARCWRKGKELSWSLLKYSHEMMTIYSTTNECQRWKGRKKEWVNEQMRWHEWLYFFRDSM